MRILCVHGVAGHPAGGAWEAGWKDALTEALGTGHDIAFCHLDAVFAATRLGPVQTARALALLMGQWLRPREQQEAAGTAKAWLGEAYERTAGMVLEWVGQPAVRAAARALLAEGLRTHRPQMLIAHSLGSLVALDTLLNEDTRDAQRKLHLVVLGSQLGHDAVRWFLVARKPDSQLTFDIDLARSQSNDNPVYYVQYAHARVCSLLRQAGEKGYAYDATNGHASLHLLDDAPAQDLMRELSRFPEVVETAGTTLEPHLVAQYLRELANAFHGWYHASPVLVEDSPLRDARLALALATRQVLANGLDLLGVSAPEKM